MRFSFIALVASVVAVANAQSDAYPFKPNGACVAKCLMNVGTKMYPSFTDDPTSPNFMESLSYAHERGTPKYMAYMSDTGPCIGGCPADQQALYNEQYEKKNDWYIAKRDVAKSASPATTMNSGMVGAAALVVAAALF